MGNLPKDVTALVAEFAEFLIEVGVDPGDETALEDAMDEFPTENAAWESFLTAKSIDALRDDDLDDEDPDAFPLCTEDDDLVEAFERALARQLHRADRSRARATEGGTVHRIREALGQAREGVGVSHRFDLNARGGDGNDSFDLIQLCKQDSEATGQPAYHMQIWIDALADAWVGEDLEVDWYQYPLPEDLSPSELAEQRRVITEILAVLAEFGFQGFWESGTLRITGLHLGGNPDTVGLRPRWRNRPRRTAIRQPSPSLAPVTSNASAGTALSLSDLRARLADAQRVTPVRTPYVASLEEQIRRLESEEEHSAGN